jgi:hypothetical protein
MCSSSHNALSSGSISHKRPSTECPTGIIKELSTTPYMDTIVLLNHFLSTTPYVDTIVLLNHFLSTTPYRDTIVLLNHFLAHIVEGGEKKG